MREVPVYIDLPSREQIHSPPNGKFGTSSTQNAIFGGICDRSLEGMLFFFVFFGDTSTSGVLTYI